MDLNDELISVLKGYGITDEMIKWYQEVENEPEIKKEFYKGDIAHERITNVIALVSMIIKGYETMSEESYLVLHVALYDKLTRCMNSFVDTFCGGYEDGEK